MHAAEDTAQLFEIMPIALASVSLVDGRVLECNAVFRRLFKIPDDALEGISLLDFYPAEDMPIVRQWFADVVTMEPHRVEIAREYVDFSGHTFHGFAYAQTLPGPDGLSNRMIGAFFDTKNSSRSQFVTWASRKGEKAAREQLARETANELNNALTQLTSSLENHLGDMDDVPSAVSSAVNRTVSVARRLLILGWGDSGSSTDVSSVLTQTSASEDIRTVLDRGPMRVVVVEDSPDLREQVVEALRTYGHMAVGAADTAGALAVAEEIEANRALIDLRLEFESGRDVADALRQRHPGLPVVYMTGYASLSAVESSRTADPIILKPFKISDVVGALTETGALQAS